MVTSSPRVFTGVPQKLWKYMENPPRLRPFFGGPDHLLPRDAWFKIGITKPDEANTGAIAGTDRRVIVGDVELTTNGQTFENAIVYGRIFRKAHNLTIRNVTIVGSNNTGPAFIDCRNEFTNTLIVDCDNQNDYNSLSWVAVIRGSNYTLRRCHFQSAIDIVKIEAVGVNSDDPANVVVEGCLLHRLLYISPDPSQPSDNATHNDCIQIISGSYIRIRGNTITASLGVEVVGSGGHPSEGKYGQGVTITPTNGKVDDVKIEKNWLDDGVHPVILEGTLSRFGTEIYVTENEIGNNVRVDPNEPNPMTQVRPIISRPPIQASGNHRPDGTPVEVFYLTA